MGQDDRYNPWAHLATQKDITFGVTRLPAGLGWWIPSERAIVLDDRLTRVGRRVVLAHELAHVDLGHAEMAWFGVKTDDLGRLLESQADRLAARRLIQVNDLADAIAASEDTWTVAEELDVDVDTLWIRLRHLNPRERAVLREARRRAGGVC